jgi:hypothetical protein
MATYMKLVSYLLDTKTGLILHLYRYTTILSTEKPKQISPINQHHYIHFKITNHNIESFHISHSYFSSPVTCPLPLKRYNSLHQRDIIFGSQSQAFSSQWNGTEYAHHVGYQVTLGSIYWAKIVANKTSKTS